MKTLKHFWSDAEDAVLRQRYPDTLSIKIAEHLGLDIKQIYQRAAALGLHKSKEFLSSPASGRLITGSAIGLSGRFVPGQTPWNKGVKGLSIGGEETQFRKGNVPQNWKPIGSERVAYGYLQRKLTDTGCTRRDWVPVHHIVWREAGREIPPGHALVFKDRNRSNFAIDNLELVTRSELMRRNTIHNRGPEIAQLVQLRGQITRQINKRERKSA